MEIKCFDVTAFGQDLIKYRNQKCLTRDQLGKEAGNTNNQSILNIELRGIIPKLEFAYNLCALIGKTIDDYMR